MLSPSKTSYLAGVTIPAGARVKFLGDGSNTIILAGPTDQEIGTAILFQGTDSYGVGCMVGTALVNDPGTPARYLRAVPSTKACRSTKRPTVP